jgi:diguanylate cyclase
MTTLPKRGKIATLPSFVPTSGLKMPSISVEQFAREWTQLLARYPQPVHDFVLQNAQQHREALATHFYRQMLDDRDAGAFLSHDQVKTRLHGSMQQWILTLFDPGSSENPEQVVQQQIKIGEVHARISIPVHLVLRGTRCLKERFLALINAQTDAPRDLLSAAGHMVSDRIDLAMEIMSHAYASSHDRKSRAEEAYRIFAVAQNISSEKERQRAALLDWENQLMFDQAIGLNPQQLARIGSSEFGLWFRHKGAHAFEGSQEATLILQLMERIDNELLPAFGPPGDSDPERYVRQLRELREQSKALVYHLDRLFEQNHVIESGRDVLTQLLNRKFLPVVLNKQVDYARQYGKNFAMLAIDIDHFKQINDSHGHDAGDKVLQQFAATLINHSRAGDYLFRMGGEEFMMLLVDVGPEDAYRTAEKLRSHVADEAFRISQDVTLHVTCSIGLVLFDGHPDYQRMLNRADDALYAAKNAGRNCTVRAAS